MYERNINVLEMFVEKKLGYVETNNIKNNYYDYKEFVKILDDYINVCNEENKAKQEYDSAVTNIQNIQKTKEKLYNQNVKFEYSRNMLFADVNRKVEDIEKCLVKIENALDKNKDAFKVLRKNFIQGIIVLNEKHRALKKISRPKNKIETEYHDALSLLVENYHSINPDDIELARKFVEGTANFEEELVEKLLKNGKDEKVPFDKNAITEAAKLGLDMAQKEAENYLFMYEQTGKILNELENDRLKIDARKKHITDVGVKLSFLNTEKDYLVQFLDNERVTAIQGQEEHDRLMKNCCKILKEDVAQINILYDLIIKETKKRATNRCYEELYNKSYLENIQQKEQQFIEKTTNLNYANGTIISPNYWRIDSIKAIYDNFDKNVFETYGRKFVAPEEDVQEQPQVVERVVERVVEKVVEKPVEKIVERIIEKPVTLVNENPEFKELDNVVINQENDVQEEDSVQENNSEIQTRKAFPKFRRIKKSNQLLEDEDEDIEIEDEELVETANEKRKVENPKITDTTYSNVEDVSIFQKTQEQLEDEELDDIEEIIRQAQATIEPRKTSKIIKKIVKKNKGKYAEE